MKKTLLYRCAFGAITALLIVLSVICINQYKQLKSCKLLTLRTAYVYMKDELLKSSESMDAETWDYKSGTLLIFSGDTYAGIMPHNMGDYEKIQEIIRLTANISGNSEYRNALAAEIDRLRVSWDTNTYKATVIEGDADYIIGLLKEKINF